MVSVSRGRILLILVDTGQLLCRGHGQLSRDNLFT